MARPAVIPSTPNAALDGIGLTYRRGTMPGDISGAGPVNLVEADFPIPALGTRETITRKVSDIPLSVFTGVTDTNAKQLYNKQTRAILEWLRTEASLDP